MNRQIFFCKSWFRAKKKPTEVWSKEQAELAHTNKKTYTVLVDSVSQPYCFLDISDKVIGVGFLDENLRVSLTYAFQEVEPEMLFLTTAIYREFDGESDKVISGASYLFDRSGGVVIRKESFNPHKLEIANSHADVSSNYSRVPSFGDYDELIRVQRG